MGHKIRYALQGSIIALRRRKKNHSSLSFSSSAMEHKAMPNIWPAATYLSTAGKQMTRSMSADPGHQTRSWEKLIYLLNFLSSTGGKYGENLYSQSHSKPSSERYVSPKSLLRQKIFQPEKEVSRGLFGGRLLQREQVLQIWHKQGWCFVRWPFHTSKPIYLQPIKENKLWKPPFLWQYGVHWSDSPTDFIEWVGEPD